jgi:hypothetical protein
MYIHVSVIPCSKKREIIELDKNHLKVKVLSPPEKNRANNELVSLLAEYYKLKKSAIKITKGVHSRNKLVSVSSL